MERISLKAQNIPLIIAFFAWGLALYIIFLMGINDFWSDLILIFSKIYAKDSVFISIAPLFVFILSHFISSNIKAVLVFWKVRNPLPGSRAFSKIGPNDPRIDMSVLKEKLREIPNDSVEQNMLWFRLYKQVDDRITVISSHKNFLLARDLATISVLFLIFTPWPLLIIIKNLQTVIIYILIWILHYLVLCKVAQNTGERFVSNVLAEYCCYDPEKHKQILGSVNKVSDKVINIEGNHITSI